MLELASNGTTTSSMENVRYISQWKLEILEQVKYFVHWSNKWTLTVRTKSLIVRIFYAEINIKRTIEAN